MTLYTGSIKDSINPFLTKEDSYNSIYNQKVVFLYLFDKRYYYY